MKDNRNAMMGRFHAANISGLSIMGISIITQILIPGVLILLIRFIIKAPWKQGKRGNS
jgi:hypothetical protein